MRRMKGRREPRRASCLHPRHPRNPRSNTTTAMRRRVRVVPMTDWKYQPARDLGLPPLERMKSHRREAGLFSATARVIWWTFWSGVMRVWNRLSIHGREHLPRAGSFILVANHESHLDVFVLAAALPLRDRRHLVPLGAEDVF